MERELDESKIKSYKDVLEFYLRDERIMASLNDAATMMGVIINHLKEPWKEGREETYKTYEFMQQVIFELKKSKDKCEIKKILRSKLYDKIARDVEMMIFLKKEFPVGPYVVSRIILDNLGRETLNEYSNWYIDLFSNSIYEWKRGSYKGLIREIMEVYKLDEETIEKLEHRYSEYQEDIRLIITKIKEYNTIIREKVEFYEGMKKYLMDFFSESLKRLVPERDVLRGIEHLIKDISEYKEVPFDSIIKELIKYNEEQEIEPQVKPEVKPQIEQAQIEEKKKSSWEEFPIPVYTHEGVRKTIEMKIKRVSKVSSVVKYKRIQFLIDRNDEFDDIYIKYQKEKLRRLKFNNRA